nr:MAG TPA: hypothetical protein [Caudoviricetes sp.]
MTDFVTDVTHFLYLSLYVKKIIYIYKRKPKRG